MRVERGQVLFTLYSPELYSAQQEYLEAATGTLSSRLAIGVGRKIGRVRGYRDEREWYSKRRRLGVLQDRIPDIERRLVEKHPAIVLGGRDTLKRHNNLRALDMTDWQYELAEERWRQDWDASRLFLTADGESGVTGGNSTIQVLASGKLAINYPGALVSDKKGKKNPRLEIEGLVKFPDKNRGAEWYDRVLAQQAIRYDITYEPRKDCWYIDASWGTPVSEDALPTPHELKNDRHLAIDLNADHLAVCVVDKHGNPVGDPKDVPLALTGCSETRDGILRAAITRLIGIAKANKCTTITVENLNFEDARKTGRETMGRGKRGKKFRKTVAGIPTAKFRERLVSMAYHNGLWVLAVDPAYTSQWGERYWKTVLQKQSSSKVKVTRHHCAAVAIGRRGHGFPIRRRKTGPRNKQRIVASLPNIADLTSETMLHGANAPPNSRSIQSSAKTVKWESAPVLNQHRSGSKNDLVRAQNES
jgi:IS605 OrfB family transposase